MSYPARVEGLVNEDSVAYIYILDTYRRNDNKRMINDRRTNKGRRKKRRRKTSLELYSPLTLFVKFERVVQGFVCERMLETEHKLHILPPLLWPSRCVFLVLLDAQPEVLGSTPSGLFRGPPRLGVAFPTTSGLFCLEVCWQLHRGFPRSPLVGCGLPYHISSLTLWESAGNCIGGFPFPTTSGLYYLEFDWQLLRGFPRSPEVGCGLPYHISSLTLWESAGNCFGGFRGPPRSGVAFPTTSSLTLWESAGNCPGTQTQLS